MVVVTGASSGIGEASAIAFAERGARVVLAARRTERLDAIVERIEKKGGRALAATCDVTEPDQLRTLRAVTEEAFGPTDVLVNSAGMRGGGEFTKLDYERIEDHVRLNVLGVMFATRAFLPGMLARGRGHVVNIGSIAGRFATPGNAIYGATKHAVVAFSEAMNYETEGRNVHVTSVNPGFVDTEGFPQGDSAGLGRPQDAHRDRRDREGRAGGHRAGVLGPSMAEPIAAVPRRDAAAVPMGGPARSVGPGRTPSP